MIKKITSIIILFREYRAGENSIKLKTKKGLTVINNNGESFINGEWPVDLYRKYYAKIFRKMNLTRMK